jgi:hypothetical protein
VTINGNYLDGLALAYQWRSVNLVPVPKALPVTANSSATPGRASVNRLPPRPASP